MDHLYVIVKSEIRLDYSLSEQGWQSISSELYYR